MQKGSLFVACLVGLIILVESVIVVYACFLWPNGLELTKPVLIVGIVSFVVSFTLPFLLITGFLLCMTSCQYSRKFDKFQCSVKKKINFNPVAQEEEGPNRLDLLPRQFVVSHFGTLLLEGHSSKNKRNECPTRTKTAETESDFYDIQGHFQRVGKQVDDASSKPNWKVKQDNFELAMI